MVPLRALLRRFWPYARPYRALFAVVLVLLVVGPVLDAATIYLFKVVVDDVLVPKDLGPLPSLAGLYVGLTVLSGSVSFADDYLSALVAGRFLVDLRTDVYRHLQRLSLGFFERRKLGDLLSRLSGDVTAIESFVVSGLADAVSYLLRIGLYAGALLLISWRLALASLVVGPVFWRLTSSFSRRSKAASRERRRRSGSITAVAEEGLANVALVQAYNQQDREVQRFHAQAVASFAATLRASRLKATFGPLVELLELVGSLLVVLLGTHELVTGRLTLGELLVFLTYLTQLYSPIRALGRLSTSVFAATASAERVVELLDATPEVLERPGARRLLLARGEVRLQGVDFRYPGAARDALREVDLVLRPGERVALVGASGAGKSTVAKLLLRFYDPTAGRVLLDGHDARDLSLAALRSQVTCLLQETLVFDGTVRENVLYGDPGATDRQVRQALRDADAEQFVLALPDGLDTRIGQRGRALSGGQRQRLAIARALLRRAPVLVLDEPTTGLDPETGQRVLAPLRALMADRATLIISHSLLTVQDATTILLLQDGRVTASGTHQQLLHASPAYADLFRLSQAAHGAVHEPGAVGEPGRPSRVRRC